MTAADHQQIPVTRSGAHEYSPCSASDDFGLHLDLSRISAEGLIKRVGQTFNGVVPP